MNLIIRQANYADIPALARLMGELGYPTASNEMRLRYERIKANDYCETLVAEVDGCVVGMVGMILGQHYEKNGSYLRIVSLVIDTGYRNYGIGKRLLQQAESWARDKGASVVILNSGNRPERETAHRFYRQQGYVDKGIGFYKDLYGSTVN